MTRKLSVVALVLGLGIVVWMGTNFMGSNLLAFVVICMIAAVFIIGFTELQQYQRDTSILNDALLACKEPISDLDKWLSQLPAGLIDSVRLRIQGERVLLPLPILSPYLVGLLVMLGLLGTFAGMVDTLKGAVAALQGTAELEAIRAGLVAPISGLSLAFGTSVAGISASALLGFVATLSRRQRVSVTQLLDSKVNGVFKQYSLAYHREQTFQTVQQQAEAFPFVAEKLITVADSLEHLGSTISERLLTNQTQFHAEVNATYTSLAQSVDKSLQQSLHNSGRQVADSIQPLMIDLAQSVGQRLEATHKQLSTMVEQQMKEASQALANTASAVSHTWQQELANSRSSNEQLVSQIAEAFDRLQDDTRQSNQAVVADFANASEQWVTRQQEQDQQRLDQWHRAFEQTISRVEQSADALTGAADKRTQDLLTQVDVLLQSVESMVATRIATEDHWLSSYEQRMETLHKTLTEQLVTLRDEESERAGAAVRQLQALQSDVAQHLQALGCALEEPMTRLIKTASETPRAAAEVISQLRAELSNTVARDNQLLEERQQVFERLQGLADSLQQSSLEQSAALETLVDQTSKNLNGLRADFVVQIDQESSRLTEAVDHVTSSAIELSSLGDAFTVAVEQFGQSNREVIEMLALIEVSLQSSTQRSDEQMTYYIAQAREIIDHTIMSQQEMVDQLRQLSQPPAVTASA